MKKKKQIIKKINTNKALYVSLIVVLILLILLFSFRTYRHYTVLKSHRGYFRQPNQEIQSWMAVSTIVRHFNISQEAVLHELKSNVSISESRMSIDSICKKNNLNCTQVINNLNAIRTP